MEVKMELAGRIVADFHSVTEAKQAGEDFNREVRQGGEPADIETVVLDWIDTHVALILKTIGLAPTRSEAERLVKAGAVEIDGARHVDLRWVAPVGTHTIRVGKKWKKVTVLGRKLRQ
jgi:tyrosyl-tRNA synthetase